MRKYLLPLLAAVAIGIGGLAAQNINRSVQLSQDPSGPIGFDSVGGIYLPGHFNYSAGAPVPTLPLAPPNCGISQAKGDGSGTSWTPTITGTDFAGTIVTGGATTFCNVVFGRAFNNTPNCMLTANRVTSAAVVNGQAGGVTLSTSSPVGWTASTGGFTALMASAAGLQINFFCSSSG